MLDSALGSSLGGLSMVTGLLGSVLYIVPIFVLGMMFYYFTGDKPGRSIMSNFYNVAFRLYSQVWMLVAAVTTYYGLDQFLKYILTEILPNEVDYDSDKLVKGFAYMLVGVLLYVVHYMLNKKALTPKQVMGSVISKSFLGLGIMIFAVLTFVAVMSFVGGFISYLYDTDLPFGAEALASIVAAGGMWAAYVYNSMVTFRREMR